MEPNFALFIFNLLESYEIHGQVVFILGVYFSDILRRYSFGSLPSMGFPTGSLAGGNSVFYCRDDPSGNYYSFCGKET